MSQHDAIKVAEDYYKEVLRWPVRRFRVEGTWSGNSRLLCKLSAQRTLGMYGGTLVELIPSRTQYRTDRGITRLSKHDRDADLLELKACPKCNAMAGRACVEKAGAKKRKPHVMRLKLEGV